jgi:cell division protein YceG involved in septum cleavage
VSKNDGTHLFSETIEGHNRAVKTLQPIRHNSTKSTKLARRR